MISLSVVCGGEDNESPIHRRPSVTLVIGPPPSSSGSCGAAANRICLTPYAGITARRIGACPPAAIDLARSALGLAEGACFNGFRAVMLGATHIEHCICIE